MEQLLHDFEQLFEILNKFTTSEHEVEFTQLRLNVINFLNKICLLHESGFKKPIEEKENPPESPFVSLSTPSTPSIHPAIPSLTALDSNGTNNNDTNSDPNNNIDTNNNDTNNNDTNNDPNNNIDLLDSLRPRQTTSSSPFRKEKRSLEADEVDPDYKLGFLILGKVRFQYLEENILKKTPVILGRYIVYIVSLVLLILIHMKLVIPEYGYPALVLTCFCWIWGVMTYNLEAMGVVATTFEFWFLFGGNIFCSFVWCAMLNWDHRCPTVFILSTLFSGSLLVDSAPEKHRNNAIFLNGFGFIFLSIYLLLLYGGKIPDLSNSGITLGYGFTPWQQLFRDRCVTFLLFVAKFCVVRYQGAHLLMVSAPIKSFVYRRKDGVITDENGHIISKSKSNLGSSIELDEAA